MVEVDITGVEGDQTAALVNDLSVVIRAAVRCRSQQQHCHGRLLTARRSDCHREQQEDDREDPDGASITRLDAGLWIGSGAEEAESVRPTLAARHRRDDGGNLGSGLS
jgi:hypothetical protein